jgi:hypothetical protein
MKNFTQSNWIQSLVETEWEKLGETEDVNEMAECFNANVTKTLDICVPLKTITIHSHHKFGLSENTKAIMSERDNIIKKMYKFFSSERKVFHSSILTYADDTSTSCHGKSQEEVMEKLEEDSKNILQFMASNGLVANESKTVFMMINSKKSREEQLRKKMICNSEVTESSSSKLLGMIIDNDLKWKDTFMEKVVCYQA